ncbi:MAG: hypothetical protein JHC40_04500 [Burkholderiales bacterium]|nr:hypothetical protein [Burkholderiales bacterium]
MPAAQGARREAASWVGALKHEILRPPVRGAATPNKPAAPKPLPTLRDMIRSVAALGGFLGRNGDAEPGTQTLWLGLQRLDDIVAMWLAMSAVSTATQRPVSRKGDSG